MIAVIATMMAKFTRMVNDNVGGDSDDGNADIIDDDDNDQLKHEKNADNDADWVLILC